MIKYKLRKNKLNSRKNSIINNRTKIVIISFISLLLLSAIIIDNRIKTGSINRDNDKNNNSTNYEAIITIVDGEGESSFAEVWGSIIKDGYPICSDLVINNVNKEGYMSWETIEALNDVGVEFIFHSSNHIPYNELTKNEVLDDIEYGINEAKTHGIKCNVINWLSNTKEDLCNCGNNYFIAGFNSAGESDPLYGERGNKMMIKNIVTPVGEYLSYQYLITQINTAAKNNGWLILFTRNSDLIMNDGQIDIYRQAFEYAKQHNVAVVTASEGYDLYYGNKLGNH